MEKDRKREVQAPSRSSTKKSTAEMGSRHRVIKLALRARYGKPFSDGSTEKGLKKREDWQKGIPNLFSNIFIGGSRGKSRTLALKL